MFVVCLFLFVLFVVILGVFVNAFSCCYCVLFDVFALYLLCCVLASAVFACLFLFCVFELFVVFVRFLHLFSFVCV